MLHLIAILISLLGYGSPADYSNASEDQLNSMIQTEMSVDGGVEEWDILG